MAVRVQVVAAYSKCTAFAPATWERITGGLGIAGLTPKGKPGGGVGSAHYQVDALASVTLASAAHIPSEAAGVVSALEGLRAKPPNALAALMEPNGEQVVVVPPGTTLRDYLEQEIIRWAAPTPEMLTQLEEEEPWLSIWQLELIPSIPQAVLTVLPTKARWQYVIFSSEKSLFPKFTAAARRKVELTLPILKVAGDLLADTLARQSTSLIPNPVPGRTRAC